MKLMKSIFRYILMTLILVPLFACNEDVLVDNGVDGLEIVINLSSSHLETKAGIPGVDALNENKINTVHYFIYPNGAEQPSHWGKLNANTTKSTAISLKVSEPVFNKIIFPRPYDECDVYAIVNLPSDITINDASDKSLEYLQNLALTADFTKQTQDCFVMSGLGKIKVTNRAAEKAAEGAIEVKRVAAKMTVNINVVNEVIYDGTVWTSQPRTMRMDFKNGVSNAVMSADPEAVIPVIFNLEGDHKLTFEEDKSKTPEEGRSIYKCRQFYSYPIKWHIGEDNEPYFKITLPWTHETKTENEGTQWVTKETYYKVILGGEILARNTWTDLTINLSAPGNFEDFPEYNIVIAEVDYKVSDWSDEEIKWNEGLEVDTEILESRYIVVDNNYYELNNLPTLKIPIASSHECEIVDAKTLSKVNQASITRPDYSKDVAVNAKDYTWNTSSWELKIVQSVTDGTYVEFNHEMNNDITSKSVDFAPYTIKFRVRHKDAPDLYYRDVTIVQNPAIMIVNEHNEGGVLVYDNNSTYKNNTKFPAYPYIDKGNVFVYGYTKYVSYKSSTNEEWNMVRSVHHGTGSNYNENMYIISTTVPFGNYILTDPRETSPTTPKTLELADVDVPDPPAVHNDFKDEAWDTWVKWEKGTKPEYYYKTIETSDADKIIAPKIRIASSWGKCNNYTDYASARKRCASYQEQGYPAGRWRVPTYAEIEFIATLSAKGIIPKLFSDNVYYWISSGMIKYGNTITKTQVNGSNQQRANVRCVYDEWYWEQYPDNGKVNPAIFTWGDEPR